MESRGLYKGVAAGSGKTPIEFLKLIVKKQVILVGADETGIYWSLKRGQ
jgi:hypothetical protein